MGPTVDFLGVTAQALSRLVSASTEIREGSSRSFSLDRPSRRARRSIYEVTAARATPVEGRSHATDGRAYPMRVGLYLVGLDGLGRTRCASDFTSSVSTVSGVPKARRTLPRRSRRSRRAPCGPEGLASKCRAPRGTRRPRLADPFGVVSSIDRVAPRPSIGTECVSSRDGGAALASKCRARCFELLVTRTYARARSP